MILVCLADYDGRMKANIFNLFTTHESKPHCEPEHKTVVNPVELKCPNCNTHLYLASTISTKPTSNTNEQ